MLGWLFYRVDVRTEVVFQPGTGVVFARLGAGIAGLDEGDFNEGHCLDAAMSARVPPNMVGKRLSQRQAAALLNKLERAGTTAGTAKSAASKKHKASVA